VYFQIVVRIVEEAVFVDLRQKSNILHVKHNKLTKHLHKLVGENRAYNFFLEETA
jgi:hypothetical protein